MGLTYAEAIGWLYELRMFGAKLGLETPRRLAALAGQPQEKLQFIHVAGTNGKGSTCAFLESIYRAAGLRVGLFTSPHLVSFGERIQVNRQLLREPEVIALVERVLPLVAQCAPANPTFFEVVTVMGLLHFAEAKCDVVIWETGMGGRLDATNIVQPAASVITTLDLDHQRWLGYTLPEIAAEKGGIIKENVPVVLARCAPEAMEVIARIAAERQAPLQLAPLKPRPPYEDAPLGLLGDHQQSNAAVAVTTVETLQRRWPVKEEHVRTGLATVRWAGRMQVVKLAAGQVLVLDGAHNPAGAAVLRQALEKHFPGKPVTLVLGLLADKDCRAICQWLAPISSRICLAPVDSQRTAMPEELAQWCRQANPGAEVRAFPSLATAWPTAEPDPFIVVTGSLHFVGQTMELLNLSPQQPTNERGLNEWTLKR